MAVSTIFISSIAAAQDAPPPEPERQPATSTPSFLLADRQDGASRISIDAEYLMLAAGDVSLYRFEAHGQYVDPGTHFGGYAHVPLAIATGSMRETTMVPGNIELGVIYAAEASPNVGIALHAGVTLPTAPSVTTDDALIGVAAGLLHPADLYQVLPRSSSMRMGISPLIREGQFFARLDLGFDANIYLADADDTADPAVHANLACGLGLGTLNASVMAEVSTLHVFSSRDAMYGSTDTMSDDFSAAAVSVRGHSGSVQPYGGFIVPLTKNISDAFDGAIVVGLDGKM